MDVGSFNHLLQRMGIQYRRLGRWNVAKELEAPVISIRE
jgi:hypothetical protein